MGHIARMLGFFAVLLVLLGCGAPVPAANDFTLPSVGTPMPGGHEENIRPDLSPDQSGALVVNQTGLSIQVAVSNTIATVPAGQDFLFMLPPGIYEFYIYEPDSTPHALKETLEGGKTRYLYVTRIVPGGG